MYFDKFELERKAGNEAGVDEAIVAYRRKRLDRYTNMPSEIAHQLGNPDVGEVNFVKEVILIFSKDRWLIRAIYPLNCNKMFLKQDEETEHSLLLMRSYRDDEEFNELVRNKGKK